MDDLDNDGDIDVAILNCDATSQYLRNVTATTNPWISLDLRGRKANRSAVGARVTIDAGGKKQVSEVRSGRGYQSHYGSRLHFGWKDNESFADITIQWPTGELQMLKGIRPNQILTVIQDVAQE
jgi:hypothetical protein